MDCKDCGASNLDGAVTCNACGSSLTETKSAGEGGRGRWVWAIAALGGLVLVVALMMSSPMGGGGGGTPSPAGETSPSVGTSGDASASVPATTTK